jgi:hypothetical protein
MKYLIVIAILVMPILSKGQSMGTYAHIHPSKDTLYLLEDDTLSKITYNVWKSDSTWNGQTPTIVFVNSTKMKFLKREEHEPIQFVRMRKTPIKIKNK